MHGLSQCAQATHLNSSTASLPFFVSSSLHVSCLSSDALQPCCALLLGLILLLCQLRLQGRQPFPAVGSKPMQQLIAAGHLRMNYTVSAAVSQQQFLATKVHASALPDSPAWSLHLEECIACPCPGDSEAKGRNVQCMSCQACTISGWTWYAQLYVTVCLVCLSDQLGF